MKDVKFGNGKTGLNPTNAVGFYSWNVPENKVYGDEVIAYIFGIAECDLATGAPIEVVIQHVEEGDRRRVAKSIHDAIITGERYQENYRIVHPNGCKVDVMAMGRCFRDAEGVPSIYAGTVTIQLSETLAPDEDPLEKHCRAALGLAKGRRHALATRYLSSALSVLGGKADI